MEEEFSESGNELDKSLFQLSIEELKELAKNKNISILGTSKKPDIVFYIQESGGASAVEIKTAKQNIAKQNKLAKQNTSKNMNIPTKINTTIDSKKVAIYSDKNLFSSQYGRIEKGYNIVNIDAAEYFIKQKPVREASPQEVAEYYGVK